MNDDGFTARVMTSLPPRRNRSRSRMVVLAVAGFAALVALAAGPARAGALALFQGELAWAPLVSLGLAMVVFAGTMISAVLREAERV